MTLAGAVAINNKHTLQHQDQDPEAAKRVLAVIAVLLIIDILILIFTIYAIMECSKAHGWDSFVTFLLIACLFVPGLGAIIGISIIIYYFVSCRHATAPKAQFRFKFY